MEPINQDMIKTRSPGLSIFKKSPNGVRVFQKQDEARVASLVLG